MQFLIRPNNDYKSFNKNYSNNNTFSEKKSSKNFINSYKNTTIENYENHTIHYDNQFINSQNINNDTLNSKDSLNLSNSYLAPQIFLIKPKNIEFIPDYFNCSITENKNIMVSDLDINLETPSSKTKRKKSKINIKVTDNNYDFKKELEKTLREYLEKNQNKMFNTEPSTERRYDIKQKFTSENNNKITINYCNTKQKFEKKDNNLIMQSPKNDLCLTIMNTSSLKPPTKHKAIYKTEQKTNDKKCNVYQIVKDITELQYNSSLKKKNFQRANSSNLKSKLIKKSFVSNNSLTNCSSTYTRERTIPIFYNINPDLNKCKEMKKNNSKSAVRNKIQCNIRNQIFQNFSTLKNKDKFPVNKKPINIKKNNNIIYNSNKNINNNINKVKTENCKMNLNNKLQKDKISLIQNIYDSYIGNNISKISKNKFSNKEKITKKYYLKTEHKNSKNPVSSLTLKLVDKRINNNLKNKRYETENNLIKRGKTLSEKYNILLKQTKIKK